MARFMNFLAGKSEYYGIDSLTLPCKDIYSAFLKSVCLLSEANPVNYSLTSKHIFIVLERSSFSRINCERLTVGGYSVKLNFNQDDKWTRGLKFMLMNLKSLLLWSSRCDP